MHKSAYELSKEISTNPAVPEILGALEYDCREVAEVVYLPGLSVGMIEAGGLFDYVVKRHQTGASTIAISGSDGEGMGERSKPGDAWPGKSWYIQELVTRGVDVNKIVPLKGAPASLTRRN